MRNSRELVLRALGLGAIVLGTLGSSCIIPPSTEQILQQAIGQLENESGNWSQILQDAEAKLISQSQSALANEVHTVITRAEGAAGSEVKCVVDFIRSRARQDLQRLLDKIQGKTPTPIVPAVCSVSPEVVNSSLVPDRLQAVVYYGYDLDRLPITAYMENQNGRANITRFLDFPTHYQMTVNLGSGGVSIRPDSRRFVFAWNGKDQASVAIAHVPPPPPKPVYQVKIRTWDLQAANAAEDGTVYIRVIAGAKNSERIRVSGNYRRGEIESQNFLGDDLGEIRSVAVDYDDGRDNNAWALDWVEIENTLDGRKWHCAGNVWLGHQNPLSTVLPCVRM